MVENSERRHYSNRGKLTKHLRLLVYSFLPNATVQFAICSLSRAERASILDGNGSSFVQKSRRLIFDTGRFISKNFKKMLNFFAVSLILPISKHSRFGEGFRSRSTSTNSSI